MIVSIFPLLFILDIFSVFEEVISSSLLLGSLSELVLVPVFRILILII